MFSYSLRESGSNDSTYRARANDGVEPGRDNGPKATKGPVRIGDGSEAHEGKEFGEHGSGAGSVARGASTSYASALHQGFIENTTRRPHDADAVSITARGPTQSQPLASHDCHADLETSASSM